MGRPETDFEIAVNLPVKSLARPARFFTELGLVRNKPSRNENMEAIVVSDDIYVLLVVEPHFSAITKKEIPDTATSSEAILQLQVDSRKRVDELADKAFAAGALAANEPNDQGVLYGRSFCNPDGHHWDVFCIDPSPPPTRT
jgi:predicted lactoylglutathione lyase